MELQDHVEARTLGDNAGLWAEVVFNRAEQSVVLLGVDRAHTPDMFVKVPVFHESGKYLLFQQGNSGKMLAKALAIQGQQGVGQHHVTQAQSRREYLGKSAQVENVSQGVEPLQRGDGLPW